VFLFLLITPFKIQMILETDKKPLIGVVGLNRENTDLAVYEKPKSALSESFRAIRSSLQYLYKKQNVDGAKH
jgi:hypothetical protein